MQRFSEDEANEILRRAVQAPSQEYTEDELRRSAEELGVSPDALARAAAEVRGERVYAAFEAEQKAAFRASLVSYVLVMAMLVVINLTTSREHLWFIYPLLGWGIGLAGQYYQARNRESEAYQTAFRKFKERQEQALDA
ncbi:hypothetical protein EON82_05320 [bacterium]|nr:MAG: hypothetical protein EON82_05320 [bacterium]